MKRSRFSSVSLQSRMLAASALLAALVIGVFVALILALSALREATKQEARSKEVTASALMLEKLVLDLGADEVERRDAAQRELLAHGQPLRPFLREHADDEDAERRLRIEKIIETLDEMLEDEDVDREAVEPILRDDKVDTTAFTIVGQISPRSFQIRTPYGTLAIELGDIGRAGRPQKTAPQDLRRTIIVDGTNIAALAYHSTGIRLTRGQEVLIRAKGSLTLTPWGNNAVSGPDGAVSYGWFVANQIANGALIARIGRQEPFLVGSSHRFRADRSGLLELGIGIQPAQANRQFPGQYEVTIRVNQAD